MGQIARNMKPLELLDFLERPGPSAVSYTGWDNTSMEDQTLTTNNQDNDRNKHQTQPQAGQQAGQQQKQGGQQDQDKNNQNKPANPSGDQNKPR